LGKRSRGAKRRSPIARTFQHSQLLHEFFFRKFETAIDWDLLVVVQIYHGFSFPQPAHSRFAALEWIRKIQQQAQARLPGRF
jgi:hypothetical protein